MQSFVVEMALKGFDKIKSNLTHFKVNSQNEFIAELAFIRLH